MKRFVIPGAVLAAATALIVLLAWGVASHSDASSIDARVARGDFPMVPNYHEPLPLLGTGRSESLASFRGHWVLLNVYASWCVACRQEAPLMASEQRVLAAHNATLVGLTYQDAASSTEGFDREFHLHEPVLRDLSGQFSHDLGTYQVPESFVIDPAGRIVAVWRNPVSSQWLSATVRPLIAKSTA